jgi:hypothetical protein
MRSRIIAAAGLFLLLIVACASAPPDGTGTCSQASDVCSCACGGDRVTGLSAEEKPSCSSWQGEACGDGDAGPGLVLASCERIGTRCWSP